MIFPYQGSMCFYGTCPAHVSSCQTVRYCAPSHSSNLWPTFELISWKVEQCSTEMCSLKCGFVYPWMKLLFFFFFKVWHVACAHVMVTWSKFRRGKKPYPHPHLPAQPLYAMSILQEQAVVHGVWFPLQLTVSTLMHWFLPTPAPLDVIYAWFCL